MTPRLLWVPLALLALAACSGPRKAAAPPVSPVPLPAAALAVPEPAAGPAGPITLSQPAVYAPVPVADVEFSSLTMLEIVSPAPAPQEPAVALSTEPAPDVVLPPPVLPTPPLPIPADANLVLSVSEAIGGSEEDVLSMTRVFIDGAQAGETHIGVKSAEKRWGVKLAPGNHLFRFEVWVFTPPLSWAPLAADWQPRERFIRVEGASRTVISLRFFDGDRRHSLQSSREPL